MLGDGLVTLFLIQLFSVMHYAVIQIASLGNTCIFALIPHHNASPKWEDPYVILEQNIDDLMAVVKILLTIYIHILLIWWITFQDIFLNMSKGSAGENSLSSLWWLRLCMCWQSAWIFLIALVLDADFDDLLQTLFLNSILFLVLKILRPKLIAKFRRLLFIRCAMQWLSNPLRPLSLVFLQMKLKWASGYVLSTDLSKVWMT